jgi:hypothetical protein
MMAESATQEFLERINYINELIEDSARLHQMREILLEARAELDPTSIHYDDDVHENEAAFIRAIEISKTIMNDLRNILPITIKIMIENGMFNKTNPAGRIVFEAIEMVQKYFEQKMTVQWRP